MGYEGSWVESHYGSTLAGPPGPRIRLASHLPFPTRRRPIVEFSEVPGPATGSSPVEAGEKGPVDARAGPVSWGRAKADP